MHEFTYTGGRSQRIRELLRAGGHHVEAWGNSREGFEAFIVGADRQSGTSISDVYRRLKDLRAAAKDQYGDEITVQIGRNYPSC